MSNFIDKGANRIIGLYKNLSIRKKLMWVLVIQVLLPILFLGVLSYQTSSDIIKKNSLEYSKDLLNMMSIRLDDYIRNVETITDDLYSESNVYNLLYSDYINKKTIDYYDIQNKVANLLRNIIITRDEVQSICFVSANDIYYKDKGNGTIKDVLPIEKLEKIAIEQNGRPVWLYNDDGNLYISRVVNNTDNYKKIGLMIIKLDKEFLSNLCSVVQKDFWNTALVSSDNRIIVESFYDETSDEAEGIISNIDYKEQSSYTNLNGLFVYWVNVSITDWHILSYIPSKYMYMDANTLRDKIALFAILAILILTVVNAYIALDIIQPINKLVKAMKYMRYGETKVKMEIDRKDELGFLITEFNKMSDKINYLLNSVYKQQLVNKEAQLKALQAQINPHFLFNTLESINWMAQLNNIPEISETVSALSVIMEAGIGRDNNPISLQSEINYVKQYVFIMKKRFEDKLEYREKLDKDAMHIKVPKLMIQPLVENAVYHGIESSRKKGIVYIKIYIKQHNIIIEIIDNGYGIKEDNVAILNKKLRKTAQQYFQPTEKGEQRRSIGIENVNYRIKLFYGEKYGLRVSSKYGFYTKVTVTIPNNKDNL